MLPWMAVCSMFVFLIATHCVFVSLREKRKQLLTARTKVDRVIRMAETAQERRHRAKIEQDSLERGLRARRTRVKTLGEQLGVKIPWESLQVSRTEGTSEKRAPKEDETSPKEDETSPKEDETNKEASKEAEEYLRLQDKFTEATKMLSFLAIDVAGSTKLKENEDAVRVHVSFQEYTNYVSEIIGNHNGLIHSTAGDGIMCAFQKAEDAVEAAVEIEQNLIEFNRTRNRLSKPFTMRYGINTGEVLVMGQESVQEMFSNTIDVAGHVQKYGEIGKVCITESTYRTIKEKDGFGKVSQKVDGMTIYAFL